MGAQSYRAVPPGKPGSQRAAAVTARRRPGWLGPVAMAAATIGATALLIRSRARAAERRYPPTGRFITVDGVRMHVLDQGRGDPVVLLHGNGSMIPDLVASGLVERLARHHRVIVLDRPGFGYSARPRSRIWTPWAQAALVWGALDRLGVDRPIVFGHSWGTLVAIAMALAKPARARALVLVSGYYYPTFRADVPLFTPPGLPLVGDVLRYTVSPVLTRLLLPQIYRRLFHPAPVPQHFRDHFPHDLLMRPWHLRAAGADTGLMIPAALALRRRYRELDLPVTIVTGAEDRIVNVRRHSHRLHQELPGSRFINIPGVGHMAHQVAPEVVADAIEEAGRRSDTRPEPPQAAVPLDGSAATASPPRQPLTPVANQTQQQSGRDELY